MKRCHPIFLQALMILRALRQPRSLVGSASPFLIGLLLLSVAGGTAAPATYVNPVLPGDYPDPSVIRVGSEYWATATTSEWAPLFPLLRSRDLVHWEHVGNVFQRRPEWAVANFWAPEISEYRGRFYLYYVGRKKGGPLSLAVATADRPAGPWTDHGPMMSQPLGSIDAVTAIHEDGTRWLLWKEDGNSRNQPTPIWAQALSEDGTKLTGEMKELFRNDAPWERNLVEGPFVLRRGDYLYCFYAGNACCGPGCNYAVGVARAKHLLGPWEKHAKNPIVAGNETWRCPGHGSIVSTPDGRDYFLYHAYHARNFVYAGRQGVLDEIIWGADGWPEIQAGRGVSVQAPAPLKFKTGRNDLVASFRDEFRGSVLRPEWQWPVDNEPTVRLARGWLALSPAGPRATNLLGAALGVKTTLGDYTATTTIDLASVTGSSRVGLSAFGDAQNALGIIVGGGEVSVYRRQKNQHQNVARVAAPSARKLTLRLTASGGHRFRFAFSEDGRKWSGVGPDVDLEGNYLPPWDRGIRVALTVGGMEGAEGRFDQLKVE
jgi:xylan 1,4-beta-xylosidase